MLLSRESLNYLFWGDSNLYPPNVQQVLSMWGPPELSFLLVVVHHPRLPGLRVSCIETALLVNSNTQIMDQVCGTHTHICDVLFSYSPVSFPIRKTRQSRTVLVVRSRYTNCKLNHFLNKMLQDFNKQANQFDSLYLVNYKRVSNAKI